MHVVVADVDESGMAATAAAVQAHGVECITVRTDVSDEDSVGGLAATVIDRFGGVDLLCNNAGVSSQADPWFGPISAWKWVIGVNMWGVVHGVRAFLPSMMARGRGHIVNTASVAGVLPGFAPDYDASKHAVVALTEHLYRMVHTLELPIGVSVLCPGWVRTGIAEAERNWPSGLGEAPPASLAAAVTQPHFRRVIDEATPPAAVADMVADAVQQGRYWIFTESEFLELAVRRWHGIADRTDPEVNMELPGLPPPSQIMEELNRLLAEPGEQ
jgi:NAD(P)-dependent dehydrogenase (short-subunit alcohol dehydrogenase family)